MKLTRILSALTASWIVLSSGFTGVVFADSTPPIEDVVDLSAQNTPDTNATNILPFEEENSTSTNSLTNTVDSGALSGETNVIGNAEVASASTGDTSVVATVMVVDDQALSGLDPNIDNYSIAPMPNSSGDIVFALDPKSTSSDSNQQAITIPLNSALDISNTIDLSSTSGNLTADSNTLIGQINTGDAYANANLINILGSNISAPEIFLGYITVKGNLTGDILLSDALLQGLNSTLNYQPESDFYAMTKSANYNLVNTISTNAVSGDLIASENSEIGNIGSGYTTNILNAQDLVGINVYGQTGILVFVNVTGDWDGNIIGQNKGVVAALLGVNNANKPILIPLTTNDNQVLVTVNNIINTNSKSGDISAANNSKIGDAHTGSAVSVVNLANIVGSNLVFTRNFGILFVTVLGDWYGSLGVDTPYGGQKIVPNNSQEAIQTLEQSNTFLIKRDFRILSIDQPEKFNSEKINTPYTYEPLSYTKNYPEENNENNEYLAWLIPFIGGSIALGLVKTNNKRKIKN